MPKRKLPTIGQAPSKSQKTRTNPQLLELEDPRLGDLMTKGDEGEVVLIGFPYDIGVERNGGKTELFKAYSLSSMPKVSWC